MAISHAQAPNIGARAAARPTARPSFGGPPQLSPQEAELKKHFVALDRLLENGSWSWEITTVGKNPSKDSKNDQPDVARIERRGTLVMVWWKRTVLPDSDGVAAPDPKLTPQEVLAEFWDSGLYGYVFQNAAGQPDHVEVFTSIRMSKRHLSGLGGEGHRISFDELVLSFGNPNLADEGRGNYKFTPSGASWRGIMERGFYHADYGPDGAVKLMTLASSQHPSSAIVREYRNVDGVSVPSLFEMHLPERNETYRVQLKDLDTHGAGLTIPKGLPVIDFREIRLTPSDVGKPWIPVKYGWAGHFLSPQELMAKEDRLRTGPVDFRVAGAVIAFLALVSGAAYSVRKASMTRQARRA